MKIYTITSKSVVKVMFTFALILGFVFVKNGNMNDMISVMTKAKKQLPIYCVQTEKPQISVSFDAAWGDIRDRQITHSIKMGKKELPK